MQLCVTFEGCHRSTIWTANYSAASAVSAVLADLCQEFGLSASSTQLWQADYELRPEQQLQAVLLYAAAYPAGAPPSWE
ncbi:hypothetical protein WJX82_002489 [Trebouxia sp. C0006]